MVNDVHIAAATGQWKAHLNFGQETQHTHGKQNRQSLAALGIPEGLGEQRADHPSPQQAGEAGEAAEVVEVVEVLEAVEAVPYCSLEEELV